MACKKDKNSGALKKEDTLNVSRQAAEYEQQEAIWLIWPPANHTRDRSNDSVTVALVKAIAKTQKVVISTAGDSTRKQVVKVLKDADLDSGNIELISLPSEEFWVRDMGPNFVELSNGETGIVDFKFNSWGYGDPDDPYNKRMEAFDREVAMLLDLKIIESTVISEGGNRELNSDGVMMLTEKVSRGRNPSLSRDDLESEFKRVLGVRKVIWLKEGLIEDQHSFLGPLTLETGEPAYTVVTTNGHIDEYARFVNDSTIILADVHAEDLKDPIAAENKRRMDINLDILEKVRNSNGKPFNIVRLPLPKPIIINMKPGDPVYEYLGELEYKDGSVFPYGKPVKTIAAASYLNFIITNDLIIAQKYGNDNPNNPNYQRDLQAAEILQAQFPNRKVIQVNALSVNLGGGGLHCISMQQPKN